MLLSQQAEKRITLLAEGFDPNNQEEIGLLLNSGARSTVYKKNMGLSGALLRTSINGKLQQQKTVKIIEDSDPSVVLDISSRQRTQFSWVSDGHAITGPRFSHISNPLTILCNLQTVICNTHCIFKHFSEHSFYCIAVIKMWQFLKGTIWWAVSSRNGCFSPSWHDF